MRYTPINRIRDVASELAENLAGCPDQDGGSWMVARPHRYPLLIWRKSHASQGTGNCVEIAPVGSSVLVRDSRDRSGPALALSRKQWQRLLTRIRDGELDHVEDRHASP